MQTLETFRSNLSAESKAYGYTLSIWGSGAFLISQYSLSPPRIGMFILGAVLGFGLLALIAFRGVFSSYSYRHDEQYIVASIIHILASFGNVLLSYLLILATAPYLAPVAVFTLIGLHASFSYNVLLLVEDYMIEEIAAVESTLNEEIGGE
ncbi:MAG: hypothetical protein SV186_02205 [Candidatus Nanohaloarchaea archaeon]|nr:hypothetical protein [Candidatus Nanohaloarchaea archaeon]